jgi:hypothetical protein
MIFCGSASPSVAGAASESAGAVSDGNVAAAGVAAAERAAEARGAAGEIKSTTGGGAAGAGAGSGAFGFGGAAGSGVGRIREIGGRNERVVRASPSGRFGRGFFSSISETVSTGGFFSTGAGAAAAAAAAAAARDLAAGVVAVGAGRAVFETSGLLAVFTLFAFDVDSAAGAGFAVLLAGAVFRAAVLLVVLVGIGVFLKIFHGSRAATLLCGFFSRHGGMDFLRFRFIHTKNIDEI